MKRLLNLECLPTPELRKKRARALAFEKL